MDWVKLLTGYFRDIAIATGDDAMEVMFTRGLAYCGEAESGGFIPAVIVPSLTRRHTQAPKIAARLVAAGVWETGKDSKRGSGFRVINWHKHQAELERLVEKKVRDAERKRKKRAEERDMSDGPSATLSTDGPTGSLPGEIEVEIDKHAAAAPRSAKKKISLDDLPPAVLKLRDRFLTRTVLNPIDFRQLTPDWLQRLERLIERHGIATLTEFAERTQRPVGGVGTVQGFIPTWEGIAAPKILTDPDAPKCPECGLTVVSCQNLNAKIAPEDQCKGTAA